MATKGIWKTRPDLEAILPELGQGCFGKVYRAFSKIDQCGYALKKVYTLDTFSHLRYKMETLFQEVDQLKQINHPGIVKYYGCWVEGPQHEQILGGTLTQKIWDISPENVLFIQMELCDNSLKNLLAEGQFRLKSNSDEEFLEKALLQLSNALEVIHGLGIIHGDIKPGNILLTEIAKDKVLWKIGDFGLVETGKVGLPIVGGTEYGIGGWSQASDVYSLGVVFIEILHHVQLKMEGFQTEFENLKEYLEFIRKDCNPLNQALACLFWTMIGQGEKDRPSAKAVFSELDSITTTLIYGQDVDFVSRPLGTFAMSLRPSTIQILYGITTLVLKLAHAFLRTYILIGFCMEFTDDIL